jgi:hypothetical protein
LGGGTLSGRLPLGRAVTSGAEAGAAVDGSSDDPLAVPPVLVANGRSALAAAPAPVAAHPARIAASITSAADGRASLANGRRERDMGPS